MTPNYNARCELAKKLKPGDVWTHRKTGKLAQVLAVDGLDIDLKHEDGRRSRTPQRDFASRFEPRAIAS